MRQQQKVLCHVATEDTGESAIANSSVTVAWQAAYNAFGYADIDASSTITNNLRFPGQYHDSETNLHYNWNRYYDPRTGRYLTPDPIGLEGGIDPYVYVDNRPINEVDPQGLRSLQLVNPFETRALGAANPDSNRKHMHHRHFAYQEEVHMKELTRLFHNASRSGRHTAFRTMISLLTVLFAIIFFIPHTSFSSVTTTYEYNVLDRVSVVGYGSSLTETYAYDPNGNRVSVAISTGGGAMAMATETTTLQKPTPGATASSSPAGTLTTTASLGTSASNASSGPSSVTEISLRGTTRETVPLTSVRDIIWRDTATGQYAIWRMEGVTVKEATGLAIDPGPDWTMAVTGDFNGDGKTDILWNNSTTRENQIWYMDGITIASSATLASIADSNWTIAATGDYNGDGISDVLIRNTATGENMVLYMDGQTVTGSATIPSASSNWTMAATGDLNGDGTPDIIWRDSSTRQYALWYMEGTTPTNAVNLTTQPGEDWRIAATADFNSDGRTDILFRSTKTGENRIWYMEGPAATGSHDLDTVPDLNWSITGSGVFRTSKE